MKILYKTFFNKTKEMKKTLEPKKFITLSLVSNQWLPDWWATKCHRHRDDRFRLIPVHMCAAINKGGKL